MWNDYAQYSSSSIPSDSSSSGRGQGESFGGKQRPRNATDASTRLQQTQQYGRGHGYIESDGTYDYYSSEQYEDFGYDVYEEQGRRPGDADRNDYYQRRQQQQQQQLMPNQCQDEYHEQYNPNLGKYPPPRNDILYRQPSQQTRQQHERGMVDQDIDSQDENYGYDEYSVDDFDSRKHHCNQHEENQGDKYRGETSEEDHHEQIYQERQQQHQLQRLDREREELLDDVRSYSSRDSFRSHSYKNDDENNTGRVREDEQHYSHGSYHHQIMEDDKSYHSGAVGRPKEDSTHTHTDSKQRKVFAHSSSSSKSSISSRDSKSSGSHYQEHYSQVHNNYDNDYNEEYDDGNYYNQDNDIENNDTRFNGEDEDGIRHDDYDFDHIYDNNSSSQNYSNHNRSSNDYSDSYSNSNSSNHRHYEKSIDKDEDNISVISDISENTESQAAATAAVTEPSIVEVYRYKVVYPGGTFVRISPDLKAEKTSIVLHCGDIFEASKSIVLDGVNYVKLADDTGWVFARHHDKEVLQLLEVTRVAAPQPSPAMHHTNNSSIMINSNRISSSSSSKKVTTPPRLMQATVLGPAGNTSATTTTKGFDKLKSSNKNTTTATTMQLMGGNNSRDTHQSKALNNYWKDIRNRTMGLISFNAFVKMSQTIKVPPILSSDSGPSIALKSLSQDIDKKTSQICNLIKRITSIARNCSNPKVVEGLDMALWLLVHLGSHKRTAHILTLAVEASNRVFDDLELEQQSDVLSLILEVSSSSRKFVVELSRLVHYGDGDIGNFIQRWMMLKILKYILY